MRSISHVVDIVAAGFALEVVRAGPVAHQEAAEPIGAAGVVLVVQAGVDAGGQRGVGALHTAPFHWLSNTSRPPSEGCPLLLKYSLPS
jgi:hypothetical protein